MSVPWIKMRSNLEDDPHVRRLSAVLKVPPLHVVGALYLLWSLADEHTQDGVLLGWTAEMIDARAGIPGLCHAVEAGVDGKGSDPWLTVQSDGTLVIPDFQKHMGAGAKGRALASRRQDRSRAQRDGPVTDLSRPERDNSVTRSRKRVGEPAGAGSLADAGASACLTPGASVREAGTDHFADAGKMVEPPGPERWAPGTAAPEDRPSDSRRLLPIGNAGTDCGAASARKSATAPGPAAGPGPGAGVGGENMLLAADLDADIRRLRRADWSPYVGAEKAFNAFLNAYGRKTEPIAAQKAFEKALSRLTAGGASARFASVGEAARFLIGRAAEFRASPLVTQSDEYAAPYPASWLNKGRYDDGPGEWNKPQRRFGGGRGAGGEAAGGAGAAAGSGGGGGTVGRIGPARGPGRSGRGPVIL